MSRVEHRENRCREAIGFALPRRRDGDGTQRREAACRGDGAFEIAFCKGPVFGPFDEGRRHSGR